MDKFQYIIRMREWRTLTTDKARIEWCSAILDSMGMLYYYRKNTTRQRRALTTAFHTFDKRKLPYYLTATVWALSKPNE